MATNSNGSTKASRAQRYYQKLTFLHFNSYEWQQWITLCVVFIAAMLSIVSLVYFLYYLPPSLAAFKADKYSIAILAAWVFGPPVWFLFERYLLWPDANSVKLDQLRSARELAQPFWAALLATLLFLIPR